MYYSLTLYNWGVVIFLLLCTFLECKPYQNLFKPHKEFPVSSIEGIDAIYVINLDHRPEIWHRLEPILYYHGIAAKRFSAVSGWDLDLPTIQTYCAKHMGVGQLGCMLSHLSIYHDALQRGVKVAWVIEDDLEICGDPFALTNILEELTLLDPEWDVLYTDLDFINEDGTYCKSLALPIDKKPPFPENPLEYYIYRKNVSKNLQVIRSRYGTSSMIISERGMKKALNHFTTYEDILWPYDIEFHYIPQIHQYGIRNPIARNGYFSFNFSDTGATKIRSFYEIDDEHFEYITRRNTKYQGILENWLKFRGETKTIVK